MTVSDNQHLEFLISQYVDDTLEAADRKLVEQQIATNPVARELYREHRETQDILDDFGGRIPLINWQEFDDKLAIRLSEEARKIAAKPPVSVWRRWSRTAAIAAGLMLAAGIGYGWHALTQPVMQSSPVADYQADAVPVRTVQVADRPSTGPSRQAVQVHEVPADGEVVAATVKVQDGASQMAEAPKDNSGGIRKPMTPVQGSVTAGVPEMPGETSVENLR